MSRMTNLIAGLVRGSLWLAGLLLVVAVGALVAGFYMAEARSESDVFDGTTAPGSHEWYKVSTAYVQQEGLTSLSPWPNKSDTLTNFCNKCHSAIKAELDNSIAPNPDPTM